MQEELAENRIAELSKVLELTLTEAALLSENKTQGQQAQIQAVVQAKHQIEQKEIELKQLKEVNNQSNF